MHRAAFCLAALLAAAFATGAAKAHEVKNEGMAIKHPWVRGTVQGTAATAGYAKITNTGKAADRLIGASLEGAEKAELHETAVENGIARMRPIEGGLLIEPGRTVELKPAGAHIMFSGLKTTYDEDSYVDGTLIFEKAGTVKLDFFVETSAKPASPPADGHGDHAP